MDAWYYGGHRDSDFYFHEKEKCEIIKTLNMSDITQNQKSMKNFMMIFQRNNDLIFSLSPLHKTFFADEIKGKRFWMWAQEQGICPSILLWREL